MMMSNIDREIEEALDAEDRALFEQHGELGLFGQLGTLFKGKLAWLSVVTIIIGTIATFIGFYAIWKFAKADDALIAMKWGGLAWAAFTTQIMIKLWSWMRMETNRIVREVKRLELQLLRLKASAKDGATS